ncbi:WD40-repeat-containing domain protein [Lipomyces arxii]|uniref:WD40-repeat-containing domain protein n=1 Tax=Lipomyces arxii TaxID=56418 RepID=UPI0034CEEDA7
MSNFEQRGVQARSLGSFPTLNPSGHYRSNSSPSSVGESPSSAFSSPVSSLWSPVSASSASSSDSNVSKRRHRILSSRGALSPDRFIPSSSSTPVFHVDCPPTYPAARARHHSAPGSRIATSPDTGAAIASALGIPNSVSPRPTRVLNFQSGSKLQEAKFVMSDKELVSAEAIRAVVAGVSAKASYDGSGKTRKAAYNLKRILSRAPYRVLDAPGLRDDFYTNLLAWSSTTGELAVGLGNQVYIWRETSGAVLLPDMGDSPVACLSFAPNGKTLVIGRMDGTISCWVMLLKVVAAEYTHNYGLCCITWRPALKDGTEPLFYECYIGDEIGSILKFALSASGLPSDESALQITGQTKGHSQQICGIAFNPFGDQMAVGANDNTCTIWDVGPNGPATTPRYRWDHRAAVKALAYCPWSPSLLATGGGSNDRTVRFWHTKSGSLVNSFTTNAQVTSLIWSVSSKEIAATFGYANPEHPIRMALYSYPDCRPIIQIPWEEDLRCLYAVQSPGGGKICAAASDDTVRFYEFWDEKSQLRVSHWDNGIFGSDILELCEGIEKDPLEVIR